MLTEEQIAELRARGVMLQKDKELFIIRVGFCGGRASPQLLRSCAQLSEEFGDGSIHLTTRQTIELNNIPAARVFDAVERMKELEIPEAVSGSRLRTVVACPGSPICRFNRGNTQQLAQEIWETYKHFDGLSCKVKISVTGCINSCAKPQENDIGFMAAGDGSWKVFVGGKIGRQPDLGENLFDVESHEQALELTGKILNWHRDNGQNKERLATVIKRIGKDKFTSEVIA